jgi:integrase
MRTKTKALATRGSKPLARVEADLEAAARLAAHAKSEATQRVYEVDLRDWAAYAELHGLRLFPISEAGLAAYLAHLHGRDLALSTIRRRLAALSQWHKAAGKPSPTERPKIRAVLAGLARSRGSAPKKKRALTADMVRTIVRKLRGPHAARDRTLLLVGLVTGLRRSELAALTWQDVEQDPAGLLLQIRRSKRDQEGAGQVVAIPFADGDLCPARALLAWRERTGGSGKVFGLCDRTIARVVKRHIGRIGLDPAEFSGHSLRSGFATEAGRSGASLLEIMQQTRHRDQAEALGYVQQTEQLKNRAVHGVLGRLQGAKEKKP